ncbi:MAG TPA: right-handed parallel beta-helix repeat-containing protein [Vicinamibacteria bacterium]
MRRAALTTIGVWCLLAGAAAAAPADDTAALQAALNAAAPGGSVTLDPGRTYFINLAVGLKPKSNSRVVLQGATLRGTLGAGQSGRFFDLTAKSQVTLSGGTLVGSRTAGPAWGHGIVASNASDITVEDMTFVDIFSDGVLLTGSPGSVRVSLRRCRFQNARRSGLYVASGREISVEDCAFEGSNGQAPEAGLQILAGSGLAVEQVRIARSLFRGNRGPGLAVGGTSGARLAHFTVSDNTVQQNLRGIAIAQASHVVVAGNRISGHAQPPQAGLTVGPQTFNVTVTGNVLEGNYRGLLADGASLVALEGNTVIGTGARVGLGSGADGDGITCGAAAGPPITQCTVSGNVVSGSAGIGIRLRQGAYLIAANNVVSDSGQSGIALLAVSDSQVRGNTVSRSSLESAGAHDDIQLGAASQRNVVSFNQCRSAGSARASVYVAATSAFNLVAENSLLGGAAVSNLSATTSVNWDGSPTSWNR